MGETLKFWLLHFRTMEKYYANSVFKVMCLIGENPFLLLKIILVDKETKIQNPQLVWQQV